MSVEEFSNYVRRIRSEKGFALSKVEHQSGNTITGAYVQQIENGSVLPENISLKKLVGLAKGLRISLGELMTVALGEDFNKSTSFKNKVDSILVASDDWEPNAKNLFLNCVQVFATGLNVSHFRPVKNGGENTFDNLNYLDSSKSELPEGFGVIGFDGQTDADIKKISDRIKKKKEEDKDKSNSEE